MKDYSDIKTDIEYATISFDDLDQYMVDGGYISNMQNEELIKEAWKVVYKPKQTRASDIKISFISMDDEELDIMNIEVVKANATQVKRKFLNKEIDFLEFDNYMTSHGYYSTLEDCVENPALAVEIRKDGWIGYIAIDTNMQEIKIEFDVTADNGKEEPPYHFNLRVNDVYEV